MTDDFSDDVMAIGYRRQAQMLEPLMELTKEETEQLVKFLSGQFIDLNSKKLYDGSIIYNFLKRANRYLQETNEQPNS
jgi:hypothetical protein